jgi:hypothetical protein
MFTPSCTIINNISIEVTDNSGQRFLFLCSSWAESMWNSGYRKGNNGILTIGKRERLCRRGLCQVEW